MGFVTLGLFSLNIQGLRGFIINVESWICSSSLFLCIGVLYDRTHTFSQILWESVHGAAFSVFSYFCWKLEFTWDQ